MRTHWLGRWGATTLLVLIGMIVMIRLGFWQLDRLAQRRAFNERVLAARSLPPLDLNSDSFSIIQLPDMEYREVVVTGEYDHSDEVLLRNQVWQGQLGFHVLTPLRIQGTSWAVLVDRGWLPYEEAQLPARLAYQEKGVISVKGVIRRGQERPDFGGVPDPTLAPGQERLDAWNLVNISRIQQQTQLSLLPIYIQQAPDPTWQGLPYRTLSEVEISEGPHLGYAIQWFTFAAILGIGYPFFVRRQMRKPSPAQDKPLEDEEG
ncbi:SURF1 family protein [uncultured Thermanaerothrix sp.]|uniref:SURF1 family protein n=1 Tax=uncultured Thermanaerothrix sp. TaxID=1195149 RepID=UPI002635B577|nr:SURF1 family protein [uncultured Thermanaerothrix sp.]